MKCCIKVLKLLFPRCCQEKIRREKISFKINEKKCIASILLFFLQFTVYIQKFINFEINMTGEFLLFKKNTTIKSYSVRGLKISKELKRLCEDVCKFVKKTTNVKYYLK